ncbi:MAG: hypothetical protein IKQ31_01770 [Clostridia bacterium]|nr:hypothetical protein [Clostridia bacterium]
MENRIESEVEKKVMQFEALNAEKSKRVKKRIEEILNEQPEDDEDEDDAFISFYERFDVDDGFITEQDDIAKLKAIHFQDIINNDLLGEYDAHGVYTIEEPILAELVTMEKKIDAMTENGLEGRAFVGQKVFYFVITPAEKTGDGMAKCSLQLLERVPRMGGYYVDTIITTVATYEFDDDAYFIERAKEIFHFHKYSTDGEVPNNGELVAISARHAYLHAVANSSANLSDDLEEVYFNMRIQLLNKYPELAFVLAEFSARRSKLDKFFLNSRLKFLYLNQLLDMVLTSEACADAISKSPCKRMLENIDRKYYQICGVMETKMRNDNAALKAKQDEAFVNISDGGQRKDGSKEKKATPAPPGVTYKGKAKSKVAGNKAKVKKALKEKAAKKAADKKKDKSKKKAPPYIPPKNKYEKSKQKQEENKEEVKKDPTPTPDPTPSPNDYKGKGIFEEPNDSPLNKRDVRDKRLTKENSEEPLNNSQDKTSSEIPPKKEQKKQEESKEKYNGYGF